MALLPAFSPANLSDATDFALADMQVAAESRMSEWFVIDRPATTGDVDDDGNPVIEGATIYE
ncbi:MAG: hypothetical protein Q4F67_11640, partial [Propionibacteriaceae bacterium]|nr:hypothetical protein [Propionibacteriaceae bacterium]